MKIVYIIYLLLSLTTLGISDDKQTIYHKAINFVINYDYLKSYLDDSIQDSSNLSFSINDTLMVLTFEWDIRKIGIMNEILLKDSIPKSMIIDTDDYNSIARKILSKEEYSEAQIKEYKKWKSYNTEFKSKIISISNDYNNIKNPDLKIEFYPYVNNILVVYVWAQKGSSQVFGMNFTFYFDEEYKIRFVLIGKIES